MRTSTNIPMPPGNIINLSLIFYFGRIGDNDFLLVVGNCGDYWAQMIGNHYPGRGFQRWVRGQPCLLFNGVVKISYWKLS